jgi:putative DNA primase/helicase
MTAPGMFAPLPTGSGKMVALRQAAPEWRVIMPVPEGAPAPPAKHPRLGAPANRWEYRDAPGELLGLVCRFHVKGGGKEIRSLVYAEHKRWGRQWRWLGFPKPRPLHGLDRLAARPDAPAIVTEGEKAADAAGALLADHAAITSPGGSKAAGAADWSALAGRRVVIWPDADDPGQAYVRDVLDMLAKLSPVPSVAIVKPPEGVAEGWDASDALAAGWTAAKVAELVAAAEPASAGEAADASARKLKTREWLIDLICEAELWHDPQRVAYATVPVGTIRRTFVMLRALKTGPAINAKSRRSSWRGSFPATLPIGRFAPRPLPTESRF